MFAITLVLLAGCGLSKEEYAAQMSESACAIMYDCAREYGTDPADYEEMGYGKDEADCVAILLPVYEEAVEDDCPDFEGVAAKACADNLAELTCDDMLMGTVPEECETEAACGS